MKHHQQQQPLMYVHPQIIASLFLQQEALHNDSDVMTKTKTFTHFYTPHVMNAEEQEQTMEGHSPQQHSSLQSQNNSIHNMHYSSALSTDNNPCHQHYQSETERTATPSDHATLSSTTTITTINTATTPETSLENSNTSTNTNTTTSQKPSVQTTIKKKGRKKHLPCTNCGAEKSPSWRRGANGEPLCNKCGLFLLRNGVGRPDVTSKTKRKRGTSQNGSSTTNTATAANGEEVPAEVEEVEHSEERRKNKAPVQQTKKMKLTNTQQDEQSITSSATTLESILMNAEKQFANSSSMNLLKNQLKEAMTRFPEITVTLISIIRKHVLSQPDVLLPILGQQCSSPTSTDSSSEQQASLQQQTQETFTSSTTNVISEQTYSSTALNTIQDDESCASDRNTKQHHRRNQMISNEHILPKGGFNTDSTSCLDDETLIPSAYLFSAIPQHNNDQNEDESSDASEEEYMESWDFY